MVYVWFLSPSFLPLPVFVKISLTLHLLPPPLFPFSFSSSPFAYRHWCNFNLFSCFFFASFSLSLSLPSRPLFFYCNTTIYIHPLLSLISFPSSLIERFLGTSGQGVDDIFRFSDETNRQDCVEAHIPRSLYFFFFTAAEDFPMFLHNSSRVSVILYYFSILQIGYFAQHPDVSSSFPHCSGHFGYACILVHCQPMESY